MTFLHKLSLLFSFFMILGCIIQFLIFDKTFMAHTNFMMLDINKQIAKNASEQIDKNFNKIYTTLERIANDESIRNNKEVLDRINDFTPDVDVLMVLDEKGDIVTISGNRNTPLVSNLKEQEYFRQAMQKKDYVSNVETTMRGRKVICISVPIIRDNAAAGAVVGFIRLFDETASSPFENNVLGNNGNALLIDSKGTIIRGPDKNQIGEKTAVFEKIRAESGSRIVSNAPGEEFFTGYSKVAKIGWYVVISTPVSDIIKNRNIVIYEMMTLFIVENIVFIILAVYIMRRYGKSTEQLICAFANLKKGSYKKLNPYDYKKEFRKIVEVYNDALQKAGNERNNLSKAANIDQLTLAYNRRAFERVLKVVDEEIKNKTISRVGFLLLDLDHFKSLNDSEGHLSGDKILQKAVHIMKDIAGDRNVFRFGGDEFAILKRDVDEEQLLYIAEKIRTRAGTQLQCCTISIGAASFPHDAPSVFDLLAAADRALYVSKSYRNRVTAAWLIVENHQ